MQLFHQIVYAFLLPYIYLCSYVKFTEQTQPFHSKQVVAESSILDFGCPVTC